MSHLSFNAGTLSSFTQKIIASNFNSIADGGLSYQDMTKKSINKNKSLKNEPGYFPAAISVNHFLPSEEHCSAVRQHRD